MRLYLVRRFGVYGHGTFGVYSTLELAKAALERARENDNYHDFDIDEYILDKDTDNYPKYWVDRYYSPYCTDIKKD